MAIHPSPRLAVLLLLSHLIALWALYVSSVMTAFTVAMSLLVLASLAYHLTRDALLMLPVSWRSLSVRDGVATIVARDGCMLSGEVSGSSVVTSAFVILRLKPEGRRMTVARVIFPDALAGDGYRELCVRLRYA